MFCESDSYTLTLVLHWETSTLITGAEDGALQIRDAVLDPLRQPQKVVDVQLYDGYLGGITCLIVGDSRLFIGGANGAIYCAEVPAIGLKITSDATGRNIACFPRNDCASMTFISYFLFLKKLANATENRSSCNSSLWSRNMGSES